ncbi:hypothetical protein [Aquimarina longa]|uniref:hypothetical protein n=1 Tax=Aquimarina longa TaxID=1080221 RepID=UPI0007862169|nr:hypothetical protein [Aquimarina longa]
MYRFYILFASLSTIIGVSCKGDSEKKEGNKQDEIIEEVKNQFDDKKPSTSNSTSTTNFTLVALEYIVKDFMSCKAQAVGRNDCRSRISKVISEKHNLSEFKDAKLGYVIYDSIRPIIERSNDWKSIGTAIDQDVLDHALEHTNKGGLSLVIDTSTTYGHVVMLLSGEAKKSNSWGLKLPKVLSLVNYKPEKSFHDKSLSYAMNKSEDLQVYIRK